MGETEMTTATHPRAGDGPLSWRDVYGAVLESEDRIKRHIDESLTPVRTMAADHEARIRSLEQGHSPWHTNADIAHREQGKRIGDVERRIDALANREKGILNTLGAGRSALVVVGVVIAAMLGLLNLIIIFTDLASRTLH